MGKQQFGLGEHVIASIRRVFQAHPEVEEVVLYGSRAKAHYKVGSDIDLTIKGQHVDFKLLGTISNELYELPIPYMVDLSILSNISNANLIEHITRVGKVFYSQSTHTGK